MAAGLPQVDAGAADAPPAGSVGEPQADAGAGAGLAAVADGIGLATLAAFDLGVAALLGAAMEGGRVTTGEATLLEVLCEGLFTATEAAIDPFGVAFGD